MPITITWTARLDSVAVNGANVVAVVTFLGPKGEQEVFTFQGDDLDSTALAKMAKQKAISLSKRELAKTSLAPGPIVFPVAGD